MMRFINKRTCSRAPVTCGAMATVAMGFPQWPLKAAVDLMVNISKTKKSLKKKKRARTWGGKQLPQALLLAPPGSSVVYYEIITDVITPFFNSHIIKVYTYI